MLATEVCARCEQRDPRRRSERSKVGASLFGTVTGAARLIDVVVSDLCRVPNRVCHQRVVRSFGGNRAFIHPQHEYMVEVSARRIHEAPDEDTFAKPSDAAGWSI